VVLYDVPEWHRNDAVCTGCAVQTTDEVREVIKHGKVMFDDNDVVCGAIRLDTHVTDHVRGCVMCVHK
jgi:hypothetical protein